MQPVGGVKKNLSFIKNKSERIQSTYFVRAFTFNPLPYHIMFNSQHPRRCTILQTQGSTEPRNQGTTASRSHRSHGSEILGLVVSENQSFSALETNDPSASMNTSMSSLTHEELVCNIRSLLEETNFLRTEYFEMKSRLTRMEEKQRILLTAPHRCMVTSREKALVYLRMNLLQALSWKHPLLTKQRKVTTVTPNWTVFQFERVSKAADCMLGDASQTNRTIE